MWTEVGQTPHPLDLGAWLLDDPGVKSPEAASSKAEVFQNLLHTLHIISRAEGHRPTSHLENSRVCVWDILEPICKGAHLADRDDHQVVMDIIAKASSIQVLVTSFLQSMLMLRDGWKAPVLFHVKNKAILF